MSTDRIFVSAFRHLADTRRADPGAGDPLAAVLASCSAGAAPSASVVDQSSPPAPAMHRMGPQPTLETSEDTVDEDAVDDCGHQPEKKRRLTLEQVQSLERNFEIENKLETDRKMQLARELGLEPKQVAIWFQNRRARRKTKQLQKDFDVLKLSYDSLQANYDKLLLEKERLEAEMVSAKDKLIVMEAAWERRLDSVATMVKANPKFPTRSAMSWNTNSSTTTIENVSSESRNNQAPLQYLDQGEGWLSVSSLHSRMMNVDNRVNSDRRGAFNSSESFRLAASRPNDRESVHFNRPTWERKTIARTLDRAGGMLVEGNGSSLAECVLNDDLCSLFGNAEHHRDLRWWESLQ